LDSPPQKNDGNESPDETELDKDPQEVSDQDPATAKASDSPDAGSPSPAREKKPASEEKSDEARAESTDSQKEDEHSIAPPSHQVTEEDDRYPKDTDLSDENHKDWDHNEFHEWHGHREEDEWNEWDHEYHHDDPHHYEYDEDAGSGVESYEARKSGSPSASAVATAAASTTAKKEEEPEEDEDDDEFGGPVKTFLEHLEDLRWTIIKSVAALLLAMVVCLGGANRLTALLTNPLAVAAKASNERARTTMIADAEGQQPILRLIWNTNEVDIPWPEGNLHGIEIKPGEALPVKAVPKPMGTNIVMSFEPAGEIESSVQELPSPKLVVLGGPIGAFMVGVKVAFFGGIIIAAPFIFFFIGEFVVPALKPVEKKFLKIGLSLGGLLFLLGAAFAYFVIANITINASVTFANWLGFSAEMWNVGDYVSFVCKLIVGVGLGFELPVVLLTLVKIGILDYPKLATMRPYFAVVILVMSAMLTPPDIISQIMMSVPLFLLYEISVFVARLWYKQEQVEEGAA